MSVDDLKNLLTLLAGAIALYASITYMIQSRHHGIDEHERRLQSDFTTIRLEHLERWRQMEPRGALQRDEHYRYAINILDQLSIVRKRYNAALWAFILVMFQLFLLICAVGVVSWLFFDQIWPLYQRATLLGWIALFSTGILALLIHIRFDLYPAFKTQKKSREWLDYMTETESGQLRPRLGAL